MAKSSAKASARPKPKKIDMKKIHWDLSELYTSRKDPKLEKDFRALEQGCRRIAKRYRGQVAQLGKLFQPIAWIYKKKVDFLFHFRMSRLV